MIVGESSAEMKPQADVGEWPHDDKPSTGLFTVSQGSHASWKVLENHFGPGMSWKLKLEVLESPGKISLKVMHFSTITACI